MQLIDTHAHLNDKYFKNILAEVLSCAKENDVETIIVCGYDKKSSKEAVELAEKYDSIYATVGVHPHDAKTYDESLQEFLIKLSNSPKVIAIGEIGLDYHYDFSPRDMQRAAFEAQIKLAHTLNLPIVVHNRESDMDCLEILKANRDYIGLGVLHCFSGDVDFAREIMDMGLYIGVDGPVTYKSSDKLRDVIKHVPLERIVLETDAPYLTPAPFRGKRNEPSYLIYVAEEVAKIKNISVAEVAQVTTQNAKKLFKNKI